MERDAAGWAEAANRKWIRRWAQAVEVEVGMPVADKLVAAGKPVRVLVLEVYNGFHKLAVYTTPTNKYL